jgi:hypothetical protein
LDHDEGKTEQGNPSVPIAARSRRWSQEIVNDDFEWPRFEQIQANADQRQKQANYCFSPERLVIAKDAPVNRHLNFELRILVFGLN